MPVKSWRLQQITPVYVCTQCLTQRPTRSNSMFLMRLKSGRYPAKVCIRQFTVLTFVYYETVLAMYWKYVILLIVVCLMLHVMCLLFPATVKGFAAVCWLYGKEIHTNVKYPIGLVSTCWGGTRIESWSSPDALKQCGFPK